MNALRLASALACVGCAAGPANVPAPSSLPALPRASTEPATFDPAPALLPLPLACRAAELSLANALDDDCDGHIDGLTEGDGLVLALAYPRATPPELALRALAGPTGAPPELALRALAGPTGAREPNAAEAHADADRSEDAGGRADLRGPNMADARAGAREPSGADSLRALLLPDCDPESSFCACSLRSAELPRGRHALVAHAPDSSGDPGPFALVVSVQARGAVHTYLASIQAGSEAQALGELTLP